MILQGLLLAVFIQCIVGPPVGQGPQQNETKEWNLGLEYNKYLQEVVQILESDPEFRKKLESSKADEIRDGTIAKELEFLSHGVRTKLDEVKRQELERLRHLAQKQFELSNGVDKKHFKIPQHLDIKSPKFDVEDLQKLIKKTTADLEEQDKQRREDFKKYEMEKKFEKEMRLNAINDTEERKVVQEEMEKLEAKHRQHDKLKHPMTKDQLEEVWEEQDHMDPQDFDPKTFFMMHDLDGNGQWDENEVRVLFKKELDKVYDPNAPEDDMRERAEEMERMREHVFRESDKNKDRMISYEEFLAETQRDEYNKDEGWETLDEEEDPEFTEEEFHQFEQQRQQEVQKMMQMGQLPQGYPYPNIPAMPPVGFGHPGGYPQGGYPHPAQQAQFGPPMPGVDRNGVPMHGSVPGQPAHPQFVPGLPPNQQPGYAAPPQQQQMQGIQQQAQQQFQQQQPVGQQQFQQQQPIGQQQFQQQQPVGQQQFQGQPQQQQFQRQPVQQQQPVQGQPIQQQQFQGQPLGQGQPQPLGGQPVQGQPQFQVNQQQAQP